MSEYMLLQVGSGTVYAFKVILEQYKPMLERVQQERYTVTGKLDLQSAPNNITFNYAVKVLGTATGSISIAAGTLITDVSADLGGYDDLRTLFDSTKPPNNVMKFRDFDDMEYNVCFTGRLAPTALTTQVTGSTSYHIVPISLRVVR